MSTQSPTPDQSPLPSVPENKKSRPTSITIISWLFIIGGGLSLVQVPWVISKPEVQRILEVMTPGMSVTMSVAISTVGSVVSLISGVAMLKGHNWGRLLYLCYTPIATVPIWIIYGFHLVYIYSIVLYIIVLVFLTRQAASTFFGGAVFRQS